MMDKIYIWNGKKKIKLLNNINETVKKLCNINDHLYLLTSTNKFYHGNIEIVEDEEQVTFQLSDAFRPQDIDCKADTLYIVDQNGKVLSYNEDLEFQSEITLVEDARTCFHGHTASRFKMKVSKISVGEYGGLFITENGQLWGSGNMHQIGINSTTPKKVTFFDNRYVYACNVGNDFAIVIVSKQLLNDDTDSDDCEEDVFISSCPQCLSTSQLTSPISQYSLSDNCPLGLPIPVSYDIETTSTSSKNDSISSNETKKCNGDSNEESKVEKNIIFRNTEAAKEFLTRQFSWMSSAGEEYLVECTEKPTRIIKENVSSMANLVYEGVKTVGDKVVTLSRHVSGSSDNNDVLESLEEMQLPRVTSKDEFMWSLSQCTEEKDMSEQGIHEKCNNIIKAGCNYINCEVWTWGNIVHGQLGIGDIIKRERPMIITKLSNIGALKVSVQSYHAGILTLDGRAFLWGKNDQNQVTVDCAVDQSSPRLFSTESGERIKDITCCDSHTWLLTTSNVTKYIGKHANQKIVDVHMQERNEKTNSDMQDDPHLDDKIANYLISCKQYSLLNHVADCNSFVMKNLVVEQKALEDMLTVQSNLIKPLMKKNIATGDDSLYDQLCREYIDLLHFTAANVKSLIDFTNNVLPESDIIMTKYVEEHIRVYRIYLNTLHNVISLGGCSTIAKYLDIPVCLYKLVDVQKRDKKGDEIVTSRLLAHPLDRLSFYENFVHFFVKNTPKVRHDVMSKWTLFIEEQKNKKQETIQTKEFWLNSGKVIEHLKTPSRRLLRESHKFPLFLQNGSRFSTHWFILLTDIFIHMNGSTCNMHDLRTMWVEPQQDSANNQYQISLKMPEDTLDLYANEPEQKIEWFHALQNAIKSSLGKVSLHQPPEERNAEYTFTKNGYYKDAKYNGRWKCGKMHGEGKLEWPDGRVYTGQFQQNQMHGRGRLDEPNKGVYKGQWKDNLQNGFGIFNYSSGDVYKGCFKDGLPNGHGCLRQGHFMAQNASIYIGDWLFGNKSGYGVMDEITIGEKYLGNWSDNKKHGNGTIVTSDGIYYEGVFNQDVLMGHGIMILDDGTHYEGDFKGTGVLSGKGVLTLKSGHILEGSLTGSWSEGIKISNGVLSLPKFDHVDDSPKAFGTYCTPVDQKWKGLFRHYHQLLGVQDNTTKNNVKLPDTHRVWQNVAVIISNKHFGSNSKNCKNLEKSMNNLDMIPDFGKDGINMKTYMEMRNYLHKAFDCPRHPLGSLLNDLTAAYTAAYGSRAHALLLPHAVRELHFVTQRLYDIVRLLFPALPQYGKEIILDEKDELSGTVSCQILLYPIILPRVHSTLFNLYTLRNKFKDAMYWKRLLEWNKQPDYTLMAFLHVDQKFIKGYADGIPLSPGNTKRDLMFIEAVETLQSLITTFSPMEKLCVIKQTFKKMSECVREQLGENYKWNMDDLFPLFQYVVVRARILQLGSILEFVEDFMEPSLESGELGIMFTTLKAVYCLITQEKVSGN
ncbi:alsin isoform X2 [Atheta coriaria]|uniref:alsin isoform X2 n=1 Tax=Dalotia coriaria TaxID=877792 RepID=UPI0031F45248